MSPRLSIWRAELRTFFTKNLKDLEVTFSMWLFRHTYFDFLEDRKMSQDRGGNIRHLQSQIGLLKGRVWTTVNKAGRVIPPSLQYFQAKQILYRIRKTRTHSMQNEGQIPHKVVQRMSTTLQDTGKMWQFSHSLKSDGLWNSFCQLIENNLFQMLFGPQCVIQNMKVLFIFRVQK